MKRCHQGYDFGQRLSKSNHHNHLVKGLQQCCVSILLMSIKIRVNVNLCGVNEGKGAGISKEVLCDGKKVTAHAIHKRCFFT